jgi:hypothetical protein
VIAYYGGLFVDTLSQAGAGMAGWERKSGMVLGRSRGSGFTKTKNNTNEASKLLKTNDGILKRTQNELGIDCTMRALNTEFELFGATRVPAGVWGAGVRAGWRLPGWRRSEGARENTKTVGTKLRSI